MNKFRIRTAVPNDTPSLAGIYNRAREAALPFLPAQSVESVAPHIRNTIRDETTLVTEEVAKQSIVAFIAFNNKFVSFLFVEPNSQGMGLGTGLLNRAKEELHRLEVWTFERNSLARSFYEGREFVAVEFTDGANNDKNEPEVLYRWWNEDSN